MVLKQGVVILTSRNISSRHLHGGQLLHGQQRFVIYTVLEALNVSHNKEINAAKELSTDPFHGYGTQATHDADVISDLVLST